MVESLHFPAGRACLPQQVGREHEWLMVPRVPSIKADASPPQHVSFGAHRHADHSHPDAQCGHQGFGSSRSYVAPKDLPHCRPRSPLGFWEVRSGYLPPQGDLPFSASETFSTVNGFHHPSALFLPLPLSSHLRRAHPNAAGLTRCGCEICSGGTMFTIDGTPS